MTRIKDFFEDDYKLFSLDDCVRSIPSLVDGLKESQRKVIYALTTRANTEIKVAQAAAFTAEKTDYHHGEGSLEGAIVGLAQNFSGSNNINLLEPAGQFGTIQSKEASASRYIFTKLTDDFRKIYRKEDDCILEYLESDGQQIEPKYFYPILPMALINGSEGIGTGYASTILNYNPAEIKKMILNILDGKRTKEPVPWYKNFTGEIYKEGSQTTIMGKLEVVNTTTIKISCLPIGKFTDRYKEHLFKMIQAGLVKDYDNDSSEDGFDFTIIVPRTTTKLSKSQLMTKFGLISRTSENLTLWNENQKIQVFENITDIVKHFVAFRLEKYEERRLKHIEINQDKLDWLNEKMKFIKFYLANHDKFAKKGKADLFSMLEKEGFTQIDRLLSERIYTLTKDEIDKLKNQIKEVKDTIKFLKNTTPEEMYKLELNELSF